MELGLRVPIGWLRVLFSFLGVCILLITFPKQAGGFPGNIIFLALRPRFFIEHDITNKSLWTEEGLFWYRTHGNGEQQHRKELLFASFKGSLVIFSLHSFSFNNVLPSWSWASLFHVKSVFPSAFMIALETFSCWTEMDFTLGEEHFRTP